MGTKTPPMSRRQRLFARPTLYVRPHLLRPQPPRDPGFRIFRPTPQPMPTNRFPAARPPSPQFNAPWSY